MNEEKTQINEILNYIQEYVKDTWQHDSEPMLNFKDLEILLDYITNLQEKIDKATNYYLKELSKRGCVDDVAVKMYNLLEDNIK